MEQELTEVPLPVRQVRTLDGRMVNLQCPVCENTEFSTSGPFDENDRPGFQHVIVGVNEETRRQMVLPVKFLFCKNCGYVMKFMLQKQGG